MDFSPTTGAFGIIPSQQCVERRWLRAISQAGLRRFRPIALTTATTFGGLFPLIFETSFQAQYIIPMAISLGFGILFSTAIILVLVPCVYLIFEDIRSSVTETADQEDMAQAINPTSIHNG